MFWVPIWRLACCCAVCPSIKLPAMGLIVAIYVLTVIASLASDRFKISEVLILATVLAAGSYLASLSC